uniref:Transmembrane protein n=1 Tax=Globodera rostochiensis TaxID=31243 RepID=A0A914IDJ7_GLORO
MQQKHPKPIQSIISLFNMSMLIFLLITLFVLDLSLGVKNGNPSPRCPPAPKKPLLPNQKNFPQELIRTLAFEGDSSDGNSSVDSTPPNLLRNSSVCPPAPRQQKNNKNKEAPKDMSVIPRRLFESSANTKGDDNVPTKHGH